MTNHARKRRREWRPRDPYSAAIQALQHRAEAMTRGDFATMGTPVIGPPGTDDLRRAIDVLGEHVQQFHRGMHASVGALTTAQGAERARLARELNDEPVQRLVTFGHSIDRVQRTS
jgi:signal transduction histidine kinase